MCVCVCVCQMAGRLHVEVERVSGDLDESEMGSEEPDRRTAGEGQERQLVCTVRHMNGAHGGQGTGHILMMLWIFDSSSVATHRLYLSLTTFFQSGF